MSNYSKFKAVSPKNLGGKAFVLRSWDQNESIIGTSSAMLKGWIAVISSGLLLYKNVHGSSYRRLYSPKKEHFYLPDHISYSIFIHIFQAPQENSDSKGAVCMCNMKGARFRCWLLYNTSRFLFLIVKSTGKIDWDGSGM